MRDTPVLSVVICTHNPRGISLGRAIDALRAQTLPASRWELRIIDNASNDPVASKVDLSWHPDSDVVNEPAVGLVNARLRALQCTRSPVLVFVDDDNVLDRNYLKEAHRIDENWPKVGTWSGRLVPEYEEPPAPHLLPFVSALGVRAVATPHIQTLPHDFANFPWGAGICVRRVVLQQYAEEMRGDQLRARLGVSGTAVNRGEDIDIVLVGGSQRLGCALFPQLVLTHLIDSARVRPAYLRRLYEGNAYSNHILEAIHGPMGTAQPTRTRLRRYFRGWRMMRASVSMYVAQKRGIRSAKRDLAKTLLSPDR